MFQTYSYDGSLKKTIQDKKDTSDKPEQPANDDFERLRQNQAHVLKTNPVQAYNDRMALGDPDSADLRIVALGYSQCGNSSLLLRMFYDQFTEEPEEHNLLEYEQHQMMHHYQGQGNDDDDQLRVSYFDLKGYDDVLSQKEMKEQIGNNITHSFNVILLYYSVSNRTSFEDTHGGYSVQDIKAIVDEYLKLLDRNKFILALVALQSDCDDADRKVSATEGQSLAQKWGGIPFVEVSAKTGQNVAHLLDTICAIYMRGFDIIDGDLNEAAAFDEDKALQKTVIGEDDDYEEYKEKEPETRSIYDLYSPPTVSSQPSVEADDDGVTLPRKLTVGSPRLGTQEYKAEAEAGAEDVDALDNRSDGERPESTEEQVVENVAEEVEPSDTNAMTVQPKTETPPPATTDAETAAAEVERQAIGASKQQEAPKEERVVEAAAAVDALNESNANEEMATTEAVSKTNESLSKDDQPVNEVIDAPPKQEEKAVDADKSRQDSDVETQQSQPPTTQFIEDDKKNEVPRDVESAAAADAPSNVASEESNANEPVATDKKPETKSISKEAKQKPKQSPVSKIDDDKQKQKPDSETSSPADVVNTQQRQSSKEVVSDSSNDVSKANNGAGEKPQTKTKTKTESTAAKVKPSSKTRRQPPKATVGTDAAQLPSTSQSKPKKTTKPSQAPAKPKVSKKPATPQAKQTGRPKSTNSRNEKAEIKTKAEKKAAPASKKTSDKKTVKTASPKTKTTSKPKQKVVKQNSDTKTVKTATPKTKPKTQTKTKTKISTNPSSASSENENKPPTELTTKSGAKPVAQTSPQKEKLDRNKEDEEKNTTTTTTTDTPTKQPATRKLARPRNLGLSKRTMSVAEFCNVPLKHLFENDSSLRDNFDVAKKICNFFDNQFADKDTVCCVAEAGKQPSISYWCKGDYVRKEKNILGKHILVYRSCKHRPCNTPKVSPKEFEAYVKKISIENEKKSVDTICDMLDEKFGSGAHYARSTSKKPAYDIYSRFSDKYDCGFKLPSGSYIIAWRR